MTAPNKISEHLANINAIIVELGEDADALEKRFAGDVEGHLRVVEAHLMEIINAVKPTPLPVVKPEPASETPVEPNVEPEPAGEAADPAPEPAPTASRRRR